MSDGILKGKRKYLEGGVSSSEQEMETAYYQAKTG
jgi:hypothetical protein